jgi:hypothetical protein
MVEYGGGINNGPAGQVAGSSGGSAPDFGSSTDLFGSAGQLVNDASNWIGAQPPELLVVAIVVFFLGLIVLKRAF